MKIIKKLLLVFCGCIKVFGQNFSSHTVAITPKEFPAINFNKSEYKNKLYKKFEKEEKSKDLERYIESDAVYKNFFFSSNLIYTNWEQASNYVTKVFNKAIPEGFKTDEIKIYVTRDSEVNAYCGEDGNIIITAGFLAYMNNEAELAAALCHEFGHYYSNHMYNDFKYLNSNKKLKNFIHGRSIIGSLMILEDQSEFRRDQERQADTFAYHSFMKNGYAPESIAEHFVGYKKIYKKYKKLRHYRRPIIYFSTHPSSEERIKNAETAFQNKGINGQKFLVDSLGFIEVKKRATDEVIYLLFEALRYDECLEMAYLQHLYHPKDEFYLFFITECLRRQMLVDRGFSEDFFITGNYENLTHTQNDFTQTPVFLKGEYSKKLSPKNYGRSIFTNLFNEIYYLAANDLKKIEAKELITNDTLEFLYNKDALEYFSAKTGSTCCAFNIHRIINGQPLIQGCENKSGINELENECSQTILEYSLLKANLKNYKKAPVILLDIKTYNATGQIFSDGLLIDELLNQYKNVALAFPDDTIDAKNKFNFREYERMQNISRFIAKLGLRKFFAKNIQDCDFIKIFPEFASEINKLQYKKLIFIELQTIGTTLESKNSHGLYGTSSEYWGLSLFIVDLLNKKMEKKVVKVPRSSKATREDEFVFILKECLNSSKL